MRAMRWVFVFVTLLHVPLNLFATRDMLYTTFKFERTQSNHIIFSILISLVAFALPVVKPDVLSILGYAGILATAVFLAFPFLMAIRMREETGSSSFFLKIAFIFSMFILLGTIWISIFPNVIPGYKPIN